MLITSIIIALLAGALGLSIVMYRQARVKDDPVLLWRHRWASGAEAAAFLATTCGLTRAPRSESWSWLTDVLLAPIFLFWGPMTSMTPERALARWRLVGRTSSGRVLRIEMPSGRAELSIGCDTPTSLQASAGRDGSRWPLDEQEGMRLLHPVGGPRWLAGTALIQSAFALGLDRIRLRDRTLFATVELNDRGPTPDEYPRLLDAFDSLASWLEVTR